jgi:hypothetical protein
VQDKFYEYLAAAGERQVVIVENTTPPSDRRSTDHDVLQQELHQGRYGFFPILPAGDDPKPPT